VWATFVEETGRVKERVKERVRGGKKCVWATFVEESLHSCVSVIEVHPFAVCVCVCVCVFSVFVCGGRVCVGAHVFWLLCFFVSG
jgi:hypothetical protein